MEQTEPGRDTGGDFPLSFTKIRGRRRNGFGREAATFRWVIFGNFRQLGTGFCGSETSRSCEQEMDPGRGDGLNENLAEGKAGMSSDALARSQRLHGTQVMRLWDKRWRRVLSISSQHRHNPMSRGDFLKFVDFFVGGGVF